MDDLVTPARKAAGMFDRVRTLDEAAQAIPKIRARYGITRVSDVTRLDRVGIPVYTAFVPRSPDVLGVYNGKGSDPRAAMIGSVMEAAERQVAASFSGPYRRIHAGVIRRHLDLAALQMYPQWSEAELDCVTGVNLLDGGEMPVPLALVAVPWRGQSIFPWTHTSGLASGATFIEAAYHALMELIERHAWSLAHVFAHVVPARIDPSRTEDLPIGDEIELPTGDAQIDELCRRVTAAGLHVRLVVLREATLPYTFSAAILEAEGRGVTISYGSGASWSPRHAAIRAITEAAQSRLTDIQGAREDLSRSDDAGSRHWYAHGPARTVVGFSSLPDLATNDLAADLRAALTSVAALGIRTVAAVQLPAEGFTVVRVVVAELESYVVDRRIGAFSRRRFTSLVPHLSSHT